MHEDLPYDDEFNDIESSSDEDDEEGDGTAEPKVC
jgi:hypothetical protein